jgi:hypothetical protein
MKRSAYQIPGVIVVFVVLVLGLVCKSHSQKPQVTLNPSVTEQHYWALFYILLYKFFA